MIQELENIIKYNSEGNSLDFKREEYLLGNNQKKHEILKDFMAFANHPSNEDKFIIIGVIEKDGLASSFPGIDSVTDEAKYQQLIHSCIEPKINFEYKRFMYENKKFAYFRIFNNLDRPYLMKKDFQNPATNKTDLRIGDGFMRIGTSKKKLAREDFDQIYEYRFKVKDRKDDIKIKPYCGKSDDEKLSSLNVRYLDLAIENISNRSIHLDVEMKVFKGNEYDLISECELKKFIKEQKKKKSSSVFPNRMSFEDFEIPNPNIDFREEESFVLLSRRILTAPNGTSTVSLPQNSTEKEIFDKHLYVSAKNNQIIKGQLTIRCDDFTDGLLIKDIEFKYR